MSFALKKLYVIIWLHVTDFTADSYFHAGRQIDFVWFLRRDGIRPNRFNRTDLTAADLFQRVVLRTVFPFFFLCTTHNIMKLDIITVCLYCSKVDIDAALHINIGKRFIQRNIFKLYYQSVFRLCNIHRLKYTRKPVKFEAIFITGRQVFRAFIECEFVVIRHLRSHIGLCQINYIFRKSITVAVLCRRFSISKYTFRIFYHDCFFIQCDRRLRMKVAIF